MAKNKEKFVDVDIELPEKDWKVLRELAKKNCLTLNECVNMILEAALDTYKINKIANKI